MIKLLKIIILSLFLFFYGINFVSGQKLRIKFDRISLEEGLSQSSVRSMVHDNQGFMWFATLDGLNKYDGYQMKVYWDDSEDSTTVSDNVLNVVYNMNYKDKGILWIGTDAQGLCKYERINDNFISYKKSKNGLSNNRVKALYAKNNFLWIGTGNGLNRFNVETETFKKFFNNPDNKNSIPDNNINVFSEGKNNILWIGTNTGLSKFNLDNETFTNFSEKDGLPGNKVESLATDSNGNVWIGTSAGLSFFDVEKQTFTNYYKTDKKNSLTDNFITSLLFDNEGVLWIGTLSGGLNRFDIDKNEFTVFMHEPANPKSLSTNSIISLYQDKANILWVGTSLGGINKWNRAADDLIVFRHNPYDENSLSSNQVRSIYKDKEGVVWVGTVEGGLNRWEPATDKFNYFMKIPDDDKSLSCNHVRSILEDSRGNFWVATDGGGLNRFDKKTGTFERFTKNKEIKGSISHYRIWKVLEDSKNRLWIGTYGGGLNLFDYETQTFKIFKNIPDNENSLINNKVTSLLEDKEGNLWIGTFGGVSKMFPNGNFKNYKFEQNCKNCLCNNRVYSMLQDKNGFIWFGTKGGLNKFDPKTEIFTKYSTQNGLPNNVFTGMIEDNSCNLWLSTNHGISRFTPATEKVRNYDVRDGLQSNEFLAGSYFKTDAGEVFLGGINGFNAFYPEKIKDNPNKPQVVITRFLISNSSPELDTNISEKKVIFLNHDQNDLSFDFVALDFIFPEKNKYKYKLNGYDKDWIFSKYRRFATYTNLAPGDYEFMVMGSNNDEIWNKKPTTVRIIIKPAFWQTLFFKISIILFVIISILSIYIVRMRQVKKYNRQLEKEVKERTSEIRQQNEEIKTQRDEIIEQKDRIEHHQEEITDSIRYAKRIQNAALPSDDFLNENLPEHFILFKPKDIVSGDFYWSARSGNKIVITAADCTGHGVPGAFMSMLGISFLNEIVNEKNILQPDEILNRLRENIVEALKQKGESSDSKDGMDISLSIIDLDTGLIQFSGAYNPLYFIKNGEFNEIKADKMPVAIYEYIKPFTANEIQLSEGDVIYMFSDGYADQFGGPKDKKFMTKRFKKLLFDNYKKPMKEQQQILDNAIEAWKNGEDQIDDICVVGVRIK